MDILAISCIHNDVENLMGFIDRLRSVKFDVIVFPGDFTDSALPKGFTNIDIAEIIVEELKSLRKPLLALPGSWDKDLIDFLENKKISLHGNGIKINDVGFYGFGGAKTPFDLPYEPDEEEIENGLNKAFSKIKDCKQTVQVTHAPPLGTKIDVITSGAHVGSDVVRKFIEEKEPLVAISAHIHEARGVDELGKTKLINPGRFPEGYCGLINIIDGLVAAKIINLI